MLYEAIEALLNNRTRLSLIHISKAAKNEQKNGDALDEDDGHGGLPTEPHRTPKGYRQYSKADVDRLEVILHLRCV